MNMSIHHFIENTPEIHVVHICTRKCIYITNLYEHLVYEA